MTRTGRGAPTDGRARRWAGQRAGRRAELVAAAVTAIAEHGPEATTEQIAAAAGLPRPALYRHFDGLDDLQGALAEHALALYVEALVPVWSPRGTPREMLAAAVTAHVRWVAAHTDLYRYILRAARVTTAVTDVRQEIADRMTALLSVEIPGGGLPHAVAEPLAAGAVGLVDAATGRWLDSPDPLPLEELAGELADWVWAALDTAFRARSIVIDPDRPLVETDR
ncbi:transcriptional regulator, TetR family [Pseudonocardia ammonioxydans]|uniref:Transcriptional regulator, TetR family n=1 Tax=Pseudonocardia ammonioxydans TaxID=260086 RepID=A0A1I5GPR2_PSUAM|nr:TetR/AcrR family transcriptional regulator [Pseudonocardia ammonioxydans]SFO37923.1 transcriptional regulator, TetR family [Pseudonocardia ammonioxydans]